MATQILSENHHILTTKARINDKILIMIMFFSLKGKIRIIYRTFMQRLRVGKHAETDSLQQLKTEGEKSMH